MRFLMSVFFLIKQLLLVPTEMSFGHFDFFRFLAVLLAFVGDSAVLATLPS